MRRILFLSITIIGLFFAALPAEASVNDFMPGEKLYDKYTSIIEGDWYDDSGNIVLSIHGHSINGCDIAFFRDVAGGSGAADGMVAIHEDSGQRLLHLSWHITHRKNDVITLNDSQALHRSPTDYYYESVHGIHLGMSPKEVRQVIGSPSFIDSSHYTSKWHYSDLKMVLGFEKGSVTFIYLYPGCPYTFDRSGLNSDNNIGDFTKFYQAKLSGRGNDMSAIGIGNNEYLEYIFFQQVNRWAVSKPLYVMLTFYPD